MTKYILPLVLTFIMGVAKAQNTFNVYIKDSKTKEPLIGATAVLVGTPNGATTDVNGFLIIKNIPNGIYVINFSFIGYKSKSDTMNFPLSSNDTLEVLLENETTEIDEVVISSTRSSRTIQDMPTRVEFIAGEELEEKANMKPGDIRMVLSESTGIQVQQTSATSANASIRIQGLDGRYTQILKDGFPLYSGAASGLGLLQTPPLDLKQVEMIKGSASTLYGGGAIAGLVNLISKTPQKEQELKFHLNGTSAGGLDLNGFYGKRSEKIGTTIFASFNGNKAYDPAGIDLTAIPRFERYTLNPRLFLYPSEKTTVILGVNSMHEERIGGDIHYIQGSSDTAHQYFEENKTQRISTQFTFDHKFGKCEHLTLKNSIGYFHRVLTAPGYKFDGIQYSSYTELAYAYHGEKMEWVSGSNFITDKFMEQKLDTIPLRDYTLNTIGAFIQNTWKVNLWFNLESGFRTDYVFDYGVAFLPRVSALFKLSPKLTTRLGGGLGYKAPTIFTEESERVQYRGVLPINPNINTIEHSYGGNWDINYRTSLFNKITLSVNQLFFYTYLTDPLTLLSLPNGTYQFININGNGETKGTETNVKFGYEDFKLFLGYTYTDAVVNNSGVTRENYLTPKHRINSVLMYEVEEKLKIGLEAYYYSPQKLSDGTTGNSYWIFGAMVEKLWEKFSIYANLENYTDTRQTRFGSIYTGTVSNPTFKDIYAPLDGFVVNAGVKLKL